MHSWGEQEAKLKALTAQYNETANSKGADSGAAREIDSPDHRRTG